MLTASCFSTKSGLECWLIDSGWTNHITYDKTLFKYLQPSKVSKARIGNGSYIFAKGKGTIIISTTSSIKTISDVLYVPDIDQNFLSVDQLLQKGFKVIFENKHCVIFDTTGREMLKVKMRLKSFSFDSTEEEQIAYVSMLV